MCLSLQVAFTPVSSVHTLLVSMSQIVGDDITVFGVVYLMVTMTFFTLLFTIYP